MIVEEIDSKVLNQKYGVSLSKKSTRFCIWAPSVKTLSLLLYDSSQAVRRHVYPMQVSEQGIWTLEIDENLKGKFYNYLVDGIYEVIDPYAESANANSRKAAIISAVDVDRDIFEDHKKPLLPKRTQSIIYEVHMKDFSIGDDTPFKYKGMYLGFTEKGLSLNGQKIGIDHLIELGVTHVHLLPVYDFITVNDYNPKDYNWGYDPYLFNVPEGSYSLAPDDPESRIRELKALIKSLHEADIGVVLDVVYNHTFFGGTSNFERLMPNVFHRKTNGHFSNGSGCGNELKTEHPFVQKFILDSLIHWLEVYQVDGFRFDLMGLYDYEFVKKMHKILKEKKPDILLYGEPWTGGLSGLEVEKQFLKGKQRGLDIGLFNDDFRNAIKGSNDGFDTGFLGQGLYHKDQIYAGLFGSISFSKEIVGFAYKASETINYVSSHDNLILMDKIHKSFPHKNFEEKQNLNALALSFVLLSFGIPFIQAGTEFLRSKYGDHNSYKSPYHVNRIHWENKSKHRHVFDYIKKLIEFRKSQKFFQTEDPDLIKSMIKIQASDPHVIHYRVKSSYEEDYNSVHFVFNGTGEKKAIPMIACEILIDGALYYSLSSTIDSGELIVPPFSCVVLVDSPQEKYRVQMPFKQSI